MTPTPFPNQPPPFEGRDLFAIDAALQAAIARRGADWAMPQLHAWGAWLGTEATYALADAANRHPPELRAFDRRGERIDEIVFDPAWHALMRRAMAAGEHSAPWRERRSGAQVARAAMYYLHAQVENGTQCPVTMTYASVPVLVRHAPMLADIDGTWLPRVLAGDYDPRPLPIASKRSALIGMGMTERQGGSDVRANTTQAEPDAGDAWRITGHKWFFSAPQCDAHLVLAQTRDGLGCFLLPRLAPDGRRNAIRINRLKDKLGNRSNASAEVEFDGALAWALHHARHRIAFGRTLVEQPLMAGVLADLALESEAAMQLALHLAAACEADAAPAVRAAARLVTPAAKYWVCKRATALTAEAMEALGGNGYIEEAPLARWYREAPVNSIWEGSGNVVCLDVERAMRREPEAIDALLMSLAPARGGNRHYDRYVARLDARLRDESEREADGRRLAQSIALAVSAAELISHAPHAVADAYCASRLADDAFAGAAFGTLPAGVDTQAILTRALA